MDDERYELLKKEVDGLQILLSEKKRPWYSNPSVMISIVALVFSFGTTAASFVNSHNEDVRSNRRDARALIQRMTKLPIENYDLLQKNKGTGQGEALSGMINQENVLLATQATELIERYPDSFTATEYFAVANALAASNIVGKVPAMFEQAIARSSSAVDYSSAARAYAGFLFSRGDFTEGRRNFENALKVWEKYPERNLFVVDSTDMLTFLYWAQAEWASRNMKDAKERLSLSLSKLERLAPGPYRDSLASQFEYTNRFVNSTASNP